MNLHQLIEKSKEDLRLTSELDRDAQDLARRKAQWSEWLSLFAIDCKKAELRLKEIRLERFEYYYSNYHITLDRRDILETYLPGDEKVQEAMKLYEVHKQKVELCERTIKALTNMGFDIKSIIEYRKLMSGII